MFLGSYFYYSKTTLYRKSLIYGGLSLYFIISIALYTPFRENFIGNLKSYKELVLNESIKIGCQIPTLDPYIRSLVPKRSSYACPNQKDWVKCEGSTCRITMKLLNKVKCEFRDILYKSDFNLSLGPPTLVTEGNIYQLEKSDHVEIDCNATIFSRFLKWSGTLTGFRPTAPTYFTKESAYNVMIFGVDSLSKNQFVREMPLTLKALNDIGAVILNGYNIVADGTAGNIFSLLAGRFPLEFPQPIKRYDYVNFTNAELFLFHQTQKYGYSTAYFEDMPYIGTFQYNYRGFLRPPCEHYLLPFMKYYFNSKSRVYDINCIGSLPTYVAILNLVKEHFKLRDRIFNFSFVGHLNHELLSYVWEADKNISEFITTFIRRRSNNTLFIFMGDHGRRFGIPNNQYQRKLEEHMPIMSIALPDDLKRKKPDVMKALSENTNILTTPLDIHSTILDVIGLNHLRNNMVAPGSKFPRSYSLLTPIPKERSCNDAGVLPHYCTCLEWSPVSNTDEKYMRVAVALLDFINEFTLEERLKCAVRKLESVEWVLKQNSTISGLVAANEVYQVKLTSSPGYGVFEATLIYYPNTDSFSANENELSRTSAYNKEPECISAIKPYLNKYCFCV